MKQSNGSSIPVKMLRYLLMAFVLVISLYPILWVLLNSFKQTPGGLGLPEKWVFDGYITIFTKLNICLLYTSHHAQQHDSCQKQRKQAPAEKAGSFYHFISSLLICFFKKAGILFPILNEIKS